MTDSCGMFYLWNSCLDLPFPWVISQHVKEQTKHKWNARYCYRALLKSKKMLNQDTLSVSKSLQHFVFVSWHCLFQYKHTRTHTHTECSYSAKQRPFPRMNYFGVSMELEMDLWLFFKTVGAVVLLKHFPLYHRQITNPFIKTCDHNS